MSSETALKRVPWSQIQPFLAFLKAQDIQFTALLSLKDSGVLSLQEIESKITLPIL